MAKGKLYTAYKLFGQGLKRVHLNALAASGAFYLFLSLAPLVLLFLNLLPYTTLTEETLRELLLVYTPAPFQELMHTMIRELYSGSVAVLSVSAFVLLWSAAKMMSSLTWGVSEIYDGYREEGFLQRRLLGALYTAALIVFVVVSFSLFVFGESLVEIFPDHLPVFCRTCKFFLRFNSLIYILYFTLYNALLFTTIPQKKLRFYRQLPGAAFSAVAGLLFSQLFSWLIDRFNLFSMYGSISIIIISLVWMYYSMYILFLGAYLNTFPAVWRGGAGRRGD